MVNLDRESTLSFSEQQMDHQEPIKNKLASTVRAKTEKREKPFLYQSVDSFGTRQRAIVNNVLYTFANFPLAWQMDILEVHTHNSIKR
jgi:hypothetical protein